MKKILEQIFKERGYQGRDYQVRNILDYISADKPHVYAAATAAGKTITTAAKFELYYKCGIIKKNEKVLIIPADKTILRGNFKKQFDKFKPTSFTYCAVEDKLQLIEAIENDVQVIIGLPQLIKDHTKLLKNVKWLVVDEAHKWYFAPTIKGIIRDLTPKKGTLHQFLLTGTPFKFNLRKNNFIIDYTSVSTLYKQGYVSDVNMQVLHTSLSLTRMDWSSMTGNLREDKKLTKKQINTSLSEMILELVKKIKLPIKDLTSTHNVTKNIASKLFGKLEKTIIFTHRTDAADVVAEYLTLHGVNCITSHSKIDGEIAEESFKEFEKNNDIKVLVSVNRGKEGFDFPELYNIIDMTYSQNFEVVMQMIGRLLRPSENKIYKVFYKVAPKHTASYFTAWMDCLIQLFDDSGYSNFNTKNTLDIRVPNALLNRPKGDKEPIYIQDGKKKIEVVGGTSLTKGTKIQILDKDNKKTTLKDGTYNIPQTPTKENPKPQPIEIEVKNGIIVKTPIRTTRGTFRPKFLDKMGFDLSLSFMEKNDWFRLDDSLSTVATTSLRKIMYKLTGTMSGKNKKDELFLPFEEAREFVRSLGLKNQDEWQEYSSSDKRPDYIPSRPNVYEDEFISLPDWLGTKPGWNGYMTYEELKEYIKPFNMKSNTEWINYWKTNEKPNNIPMYPQNTYKEWEDWNKFLSKKEKQPFLSYDEAKKYVQKLKFTKGKDFFEWSKNDRPDFIPSNPQNTYKEWEDWGKFLGTGVTSYKNIKFLNYKQAKKFVHTLHLRNAEEWRKYSSSGKRPHNLPADPRTYYKKTNEWEDWGKWLGNGKVNNKDKYTLKDIKYVERLLLKGFTHKEIMLKTKMCRHTVYKISSNLKKK